MTCVCIGNHDDGRSRDFLFDLDLNFFVNSPKQSYSITFFFSFSPLNL